MNIFTQGYLDSLCGVYSIVNADSIVNDSSKEESTLIFNSIIKYLSKKKILKDIILDGSDHRTISSIMRDLVGHRFSLKITNRKGVKNLKEWWQYSKGFLDEKENRAVIISLGGKSNHLTAAYRMTDRLIFLRDSYYRTAIKRNMCSLFGVGDERAYVIYPSQCWYLGKE